MAIRGKTEELQLLSGMVLIGTVGAVVVASGLDALTIVFWRSVIGAVFLIVWCLATGVHPVRDLTGRSLLLGMVAGVSLVVSWAAFFAGILLTSITTATILFHIQPFLIVLIGALVWKDRIAASHWVWLGCAFLGVCLASTRALHTGDLHADALLGVLILLGGALSYAITAVVGKALQDQRSEITTLIQTIAGVLIFLPFVDFEQTISLTAWSWLMVIGVVHTGIAWILIFAAFPRVSTPMMAVLSFVNPLTAILCDWLFFDQLIGPLQATGMGLIIFGTLGIKLGWRVVGTEG